LLVVDVQYNFVGARGGDDEYPMAGDSVGAWQAVENIQKLIGAFRREALPIIYVTVDKPDNEKIFDSFARKKNKSVSEKLLEVSKTGGSKIVKEIEPLSNEVVISKRYASAFFGTPLISYLNTLKADTLIVVGLATSGCIRATVVDAASYNFNVIVVEDCVADRIDVSHKVALFDMNLKYADVNPLCDVLEYLENNLPLHNT